MMKRIAFCSLGAVVGVLSLPVAATGPEMYAVDFTGTGVPQGWTVENGEYRSPEYSNAVDRIELRYSGADTSASATISAFPKQGDGTMVATLSAASSGASFDFPETTDFRSFRIAVNGLALSSFTAYVSADMLGMPSGVAISNNITGTSFDATWSPVGGAPGYRVYVWTNAVVGASAGTAVWQETFANAPATSSTGTTFKDSYTDSGASGWHAETVYAYSQEGAVRVGNTKNKGVLVSPPLPAFSETPLALRITAWRQTTDEGRDMPLGVVSGGVTNIVGVVTLGDEAAQHHVALPALHAGDRIAIFSPTNKTSARAIIDDVAILSGYSEGSLEPSYIQNVDVGLATVYSFTGLPSVPVQFAVEAYGRRGVTSEKTEAVEVDLANPEKVPQLNACPLSSLTSSTLTYTQNFDSTAAITAPTGNKDWFNGTTIMYWQAYKNASAVDSFSYNGGGGATGGLYAFATNRNDPVRALGAYSTQNDEFSFGLAFTNDTERTVTLSSVAYLAQQWGFANNANQKLSVSVMVTNNLNWISAYSDGWTEIGSTQSTVYGAEDVHDTPVSTPVEATPAEEISIAPGQVLMLKWTIHSLTSGKPGMMGIDDVTVTFSNKPRGIVIKLAGGARAP